MESNNGARGLTGCTGTLNLSTQQQPFNLTGRVHHLPCSVKFNGPSDISNYFNPKSTGIEVDVNGGLAVQESFFRGRNLQGVTVPLPQGYSGFVLGKKNSSKGKNNKAAGRTEDSERRENEWEALAKCENITFWNHDSLPSQDDASLRLFHCFSVAKALHEPVTTEELK